jgi:chemotaxis protein methyltransferase CheR
MPVSESAASFVRDMVRRRAAIALDPSKDYLIECRLEPLAKAHGLRGIDELVARASAGEQALHVAIVEALATHETSFFRDKHPFDALERELLPRLAEARARSRNLTVWSAACSSGQEVYSIAMLLLERFPTLAGWPTRLIATDLSEQVLAKARAARFSQLEVNRGLPASHLVKYFTREGMQWVLTEPVRKLVEFRQLNLIEPIPPTLRPDIVFLRNVLIYFEPPIKRAILDGVRQVLAPDGALFLGTAETPVNVCNGWEPVTVGQATYYRVRR